MSNDSIQTSDDDDELRKEYDLSKLPVVPNGRYAPERRAGSNVVALEPDLARAFPSDAVHPPDEAVNKALRRVLQAAQIPEKAILSPSGRASIPISTNCSVRCGKENPGGAI